MARPRAIGLAEVYTRGLGLVFCFIALLMLFAPEKNLQAHGIDFSKLNVGGQAEISAYYVGTSWAIGFVMLTAEITMALETAIFTLGGFVITRLFAYARTGVDKDSAVEMFQHAMFAAELNGTLAGIFLLFSMRGKKKADKRS